jgi:putative ABC transport system permease protein
MSIAWLQLSREKSRLLVALAGIAFADILIFMQMGFQDALYDSSVLIHERLDGDIFLISPQSTALFAMKSFPRRRLYQSVAVAGVKSVSPLYLDLGLWKNPVDRSSRSIFAIAFNPKEAVLNLPTVQSNLDRIKLKDTILFDEASQEKFGPIGKLFKEGKTVETEVRNKRIKVGGLFAIGPSFGADGNIVMSDITFKDIFERDLGLIDIGVVKVKPGLDSARVASNIKENLPQDVVVLTRQEFIDWEKNYWKTGTSIGFIFSLGIGMGFIVGIVIVYQILSTEVADHLPEYATLKAMGYKQIFLLSVVFQEAIILSILGFIPGTGISLFLYNLTRNATQLPMLMTVSKAAGVLMLTILMCLISGAIAVRKLGRADPADIF